MFSNQKVLDRLEALNVLLIQADNTDKLQSINDDLKRYGRANLPVNLVVASRSECSDYCDARSLWSG